ncbi:MAG: hypothetical protein VSS52_005280, partial [Thiotrichaceae bacterium]|nr:hypothetical protein [Thiotrichaceae bacterium]
AKPAASPEETPLIEQKDQYFDLEEAVGNYMSLWSKQDIRAMYKLENWEGGEELDEISYIQEFKKDLEIYDWRVSLVQQEGGGVHKVLIVIKHNPPKHVRAFVAKGIKLSSTLSQWWKKDGDKYAHLYNVEQQRLGTDTFFPKELANHKPSTPEELKESVDEEEHSH